MWGVSDEGLLAGLAAGDPEAAAAFVRRFQHRVFGVAYAILADTDEAEDVAQDVMARVWRNAAGFDSMRGSVTSWVLAIARNLAIDRLRLRRSSSVDPGGVLDLRPAADATPEEAALATEAADRVRAAVVALPAEQRRALVLAAVYGFTAQEISERDDLPLGTVKTRIRAALGKVRAAVAARNE
jgi:RNA polymerase sigma-70 factor (ECF subfamily)